MTEADRFSRWVSASFVTARFEMFMPITVQGLGKLDSDLIIADHKFLQLTDDQRANESQGLALNYGITLSYLWVLGAYEIVRSIDQRCRETDELQPIRDRSLKQKYDFERLRIPLAKFEPARRHKETDSKIAYPALNLDFGIAWQVAESTFITRRELSDGLLNFLEDLRGNAVA